MDVQKQVDYWTTGSQEDLAAAQSLLEAGHYRHALFFAHLAVEKSLKAHVTRQMLAMPPKSDDLARLALLAELDLSAEQKGWLRELNMFQVAGLYPDTAQAVIDRPATEPRVSQAREFCRKLTAHLSR